MSKNVYRTVWSVPEQRTCYNCELSTDTLPDLEVYNYNMCVAWVKQMSLNKRNILLSVWKRFTDQTPTLSGPSTNPSLSRSSTPKFMTLFGTSNPGHQKRKLFFNLTESQQKRPRCNIVVIEPPINANSEQKLRRQGCQQPTLFKHSTTMFFCNIVMASWVDDHASSSLSSVSPSRIAPLQD